jgi:hypothetical protein
MSEREWRLSLLLQFPPEEFLIDPPAPTGYRWYPRKEQIVMTTDGYGTRGGGSRSWGPMTTAKVAENGVEITPERMMYREMAVKYEAILAELRIIRSLRDGAPTLHSGKDWHVGVITGGDNEIHIILGSTEEAKAWIAWLFDNCGRPDPSEMGKNDVV